MNLVDSCGWLEYFADGPNAAAFAPALEKSAQLLVPTICLAEVFKVICRQRGEGPALSAIAHMRQGTVVDLSAAIALRAGKVMVEERLPLADSIIMATAREHRAVIWTQDEHFKGRPEARYFKP
jgi:predicted nucleic acid-binding protein